MNGTYFPRKQLRRLLAASLLCGQTALTGFDAEAFERLLGSAQELTAKGEYAAAKEFAGRALRAAEEFGADNFRVGVELNQVAMLDQIGGDMVGAEAGFLRGARILEENGEQKLGLAILLDNLANLHTERGRSNAKVEAFRRRALELSRSELGPRHPEVAIQMANLASVRVLQNAFDESKVLFNEALAILEEDPSKYGRYLPSVLSNLAVLHLRNDRINEAIACSRRAVEIQEATIGPNHVELLRPLLNLGRLQLYKGEVATALQSLDRALKVGEEAFGREHFLVAEILVSQAEALRKARRTKEAKVVEERARRLSLLSPEPGGRKLQVDLADLLREGRKLRTK